MTSRALRIVGLALLAYAVLAVFASGPISQTHVLLCAAAIAALCAPFVVASLVSLGRKRRLASAARPAFPTPSHSIPEGDLVWAARIARARLPGGSTLGEVAEHVLSALAEASPRERDALCMITFDPPRIARLEQALKPSPFVGLDGFRKTVFEAPYEIVQRIELSDEPGHDALRRTMDRLGVTALVPCTDHDVPECVIGLGPPIGAKRVMRRSETHALQRLGRSVAQVLAVILSNDRLRARIAELQRAAAHSQLTAEQAVAERERALAESVAVRRAQVDPYVTTIAESSSRPVERFRLRSKELLSRRPFLYLSGPAGGPLESFARYAHRESRLSEGPCLHIDCSGTDPEELHTILFSELGYWSLAHRGTLVLSHLAAAPREVQSALVDALKERVSGDDPNAGPQLIATGRAPMVTLADRGAIHPSLAQWFEDQETTAPHLRDHETRSHERFEAQARPS